MMHHSNERFGMLLGAVLVAIFAVSAAVVGSIRAQNTPQELPANVDFVVQIKTPDSVVRLVDSAGKQVASIDFGDKDEVTITLKRRK